MKKRIFSFFCSFAVIMLFITALPCRAEGELVEISQNSPFQMTVLGDSIAAGYGLEGYDRSSEPCYECASYANILAEKYGLSPDLYYYNYAVSGATTDDLIRTLRDSKTMKKIKNSDTILISIGGNDLLHVLWSALGNDEWTIVDNTDESGFNVDVAQLMEALATLDDDIDEALSKFEKNFNTIIDMIREENPNALVIISTLYDPFQGSEALKPITAISTDALQRYNEIIKNNSTDDEGNTRYTVVDVAAEFSGKEAELTNIADFDIHPNAEGHSLIAQILDEEITSHTFTTWIIDTSASASESATAEEKEEAKQFASVMLGFFIMLVVMITVLLVHSLHKLKNT